MLRQYGEWEPIFHYFLDPASYWKDFGELDITIEVPEGYEMNENTLPGIEQQEEITKYYGRYDKLPEDNLVFTLRKVSIPKISPIPHVLKFGFVFVAMTIIIGLFVWLILIIRNKKKSFY